MKQSQGCNNLQNVVELYNHFLVVKNLYSVCIIVSGVICYVIFSFRRLAILAARFLVVSDNFQIYKIYRCPTYHCDQRKYNYKSYTAHPETLRRVINRPRYFWKNLFINRPRTKYSLKGVQLQSTLSSIFPFTDITVWKYLKSTTVHFQR